MEAFDLSASRDILKLWVPASLQMLVDWTRPLIFNLFVSRNIASSALSPEASELEEDAVGLAVMSLNLILFATAYGFNGAVDSYASVAFGAGDRRELFSVLYRQAVLLCGLSVLALLLLLYAERIYLLVGLHGPLAQRAARLTQLMGWAVPGDFAYDGISRWMRGQQLHRTVAACSLAALCLNVSVNIGLASPTSPTFAPLLALIVQNSSLPFLLVGAYAAAAAKAPLCGAKAQLSAPTAAEVLGAPLWAQLRVALAAMCWTCAECAMTTRTLEQAPNDASARMWSVCVSPRRLWAWELQVFEASALGPGNAAAYTLLSSTCVRSSNHRTSTPDSAPALSADTRC